jgi:hypothetical protein
MNRNDNPVTVARRLLLERRRGLIKSLCFAQQDERSEVHMDLIVRFQAVIDQIAREEVVAS